MFSADLISRSAGARRLRLDFVQTTPRRHLFGHIGKSFGLVEGFAQGGVGRPDNAYQTEQKELLAKALSAAGMKE
jgi:hypothetical protein